MDNVIAESERIILRLMDAGDEAQLKSVWCDPETMKYCGGAMQPERILEIIKRDRRVYAKCGNAVFAVVRKADRKLIGIAGCKLDEENPRRGELIYHFAREAWGKGYATETVQAYLDWVRMHGRMDFVHASVMPENMASISVLKKCGFNQNGFVQFADTGFVDEPYFELKI